MSFVGYTLINEIVNNKRTTNPSEILKRLHLNVFFLLRQHKETAKSMDGMDMSLCTIDLQNKTLEFAGARNPLYIVHNDELTQVRGDIDFIGGYAFKDNTQILKDFTTHKIDYKVGSTLFLFSDGFWDQFGSTDLEKFGRAHFRELLIETAKLPIDQQKNHLAKIFDLWKGKNEQTDDVLVIGIPLL
jgi:serine phosphatase RsbU (regulator of sigma subunit)